MTLAPVGAIPTPAVARVRAGMTATNQAKPSTIATKTPRAPSTMASRTNGMRTRYDAKKVSMRRTLRHSVRFQLRVPNPMQAPTDVDWPIRPASIRAWNAGPITANTPR